MDIAVQLGAAMRYLLFKKNGLSVEFLFLLTFCESRLRHPCHVMPDLSSMDIVSIGHCNFVATALFFNRGDSDGKIQPPARGRGAHRLCHRAAEWVERHQHDGDPPWTEQRRFWTDAVLQGMARLEGREPNMTIMDRYDHELENARGSLTSPASVRLQNSTVRELRFYVSALATSGDDRRRQINAVRELLEDMASHLPWAGTSNAMDHARDEADLALTRIIATDFPAQNLTKYIQCADLSSEEDLRALNAIAERTDAMTEAEATIFSSALDSESINGLDDVLRIAHSLEQYEITPEVTSDRELGGWLVENNLLGVSFPEAVRPYLDYVAIGAEYYANHGGDISAAWR